MNEGSIAVVHADDRSGDDVASVDGVMPDRVASESVPKGVSDPVNGRAGTEQHEPLANRIRRSARGTAPSGNPA